MYSSYGPYGPADAAIFSRVLSGIGGFFIIIAVFAIFSIVRYAFHSRLAAIKAAKQQEKAFWDNLADTAKVSNPETSSGSQQEKLVFTPHMEGIGSTEGKGSSVRMTPEPVAQNPKPQDRPRPRPEPKPAPPSGSMDFQSTEGVGTSAYQSPAPAQIADSQYKNIDRKLPADKLRAAIVMSEILAKPVSLRKRDARIGR